MLSLLRPSRGITSSPAASQFRRLYTRTTSPAPALLQQLRTPTTSPSPMASAFAAPLHTTGPSLLPPPPPSARRAHNNEVIPTEAPTTDFSRMDMLGDTPTPTTAVDACLPDGFRLDSGVRIAGGDGALLVAGEAFAWRPWQASTASPGEPPASRRLLNARGQWEVPPEAFGLLSVIWPRPDLLLLGLGPQIRPLSPATRQLISSLGMRVEVLDTRNAASQFNMLATERGVENVAAALLPVGWTEVSDSGSG